MNDEAEREQPTEAWGDKVMPVVAAERQAEFQRLDGAGGQPPQSGEPPSAEAAEPLLDVAGRPATPDPGSAPPFTTPIAQTDSVAGNWAPAEGPGNEAMEGGESPAPRSLTGGAMGRTAAGLSPSFPDAATGAPPDLDAPTSPANGTSSQGTQGQNEG